MAKATFPVQQSTLTRRTELLGQGQRMSNFLYNLAQNQAIPEDWRKQAKMLADSWDRIERAEGE